MARVMLLADQRKLCPWTVAMHTGDGCRATVTHVFLDADAADNVDSDVARAEGKVYGDAGDPGVNEGDAGPNTQP